MKKWIALILGICFWGSLVGQTVFEGQLLSGDEFLIPLIGASVKIVGKDEGVFTNIDGEYEIKVEDNIDSIEVEISYVAYLERTVTLRKNEYQKFYLKVAPYEECLTATIIEKKLFWKDNSPNATKIPLRQLQANTQTIITPVLNRVPGVFMHSGALNTNRITIRGIGNRSQFSTTKVKAYLDEIPLTSGVGETTIEDIDLSIVNDVQVLKGPTASIYGAGLGGMIGLGTGDMLIQPNYVEAQAAFGSYGLRRNVVQTKLGKTNKYSLLLNFNNTHSNGYRENNEYDRTGFAGLLSIKPTEKSKITALMNYTKSKAFIPSSLNQEDFNNNPERAAFTWAQIQGFEDYEKTILGISYQTDLIKNKLRNTTSLFTNGRENYEPRPFNILNEKSLALGGRTLFEITPLNVVSVKVGAEYFQEKYDWQTYEQNDGTIGQLLSNNREIRNYLNVFAQVNWDVLKTTRLTAGLNLNDTNYDYTDRFLFNGDKSGEYGFALIASPSLALTQEIPNSFGLYQWTVFALASHGFSPPTLEETLTPDGEINTEIQPERGWNFELGTKGEWRDLSFNISAYSMRIQDLLVARRTALDQFVGINAGKTQHNGVEAALDYRRSFAEWYLDIFANYTFSDYQFKDFVDGEDDFSGNELTGTAPHLFTAGFNTDFAFGLYTNLNYQFTDAMPMRDDNSIYSEAFQVVNFKIGWEKAFFQKLNLNIYGGINNVLEEKYASMILINAGSFGGAAPRYYYPGLPRNFYGGMRLKYLF